MPLNINQQKYALILLKNSIKLDSEVHDSFLLVKLIANCII